MMQIFCAFFVNRTVLYPDYFTVIYIYFIFLDDILVLEAALTYFKLKVSDYIVS